MIIEFQYLKCDARVALNVRARREKKSASLFKGGFRIYEPGAPGRILFMVKIEVFALKWIIFGSKNTILYHQMFNLTKNMFSPPTPNIRQIL